MFDLASFYTTPTAATSLSDAGKQEATPKEGGLGIFDLLLSQLEQQIANGEGLEDGQTEGDAQSVLLSQDVGDSDGLNDDTKLNLLRALAGNDAVADDVAQLDEIAELDLIAEIEQTLALNQRIFDNKIQAGTGNDDLLIDKETGEIIVPDIAKSLNLLETGEQLSSGDIDAIIESIDFNTSNLTPAQISLVQDIQNGTIPTDVDAEDAAAILNVLQSGLVALVAPQAGIASARIQSTDTPTPAQSGFAGTPDAINISEAGKSDAALGARAANLHANDAPLPFTDGDLHAEGDMDFEQILKNAAGKASNSGNGNVQADGNVIANTNNSNASQEAFSNVLQTWPFAGAGSLYGNAGFSDSIAEQLGLTLNGGQSMAQGSLSALVNQAQSASQSHPATQMVAASIAKGVQNGDTNISLRLDPPGLGRVEIQMTLTKERTMKAVVTSEKPETFLMLQRDSQVLERALQDAGLDADNGLSFELAQDGEFFDRHNQRGGGHEQGGTGRGSDADGEELEIIESTMTWRVDPETGHTRYDIYA